MIKKILICIYAIAFFSCKQESDSVSLIENPNILSYRVHLKKQDLKMYWKAKNDSNYFNFERLSAALKKENKTLVFATNGGMYNKNTKPQGLYIEDYKTLSKLDTLQKGYGNFYLQPNGIFYLTNTKTAKIVSTQNFINNKNIQYATQSGPMLVINGALHSKFNKGSANTNIRNGVGVLPNGDLLFAMSTQKINFYDFATYFKDNGCKNALYLDGYISKTYLPAKTWEQWDGKLGVIIAETRKQ